MTMKPPKAVLFDLDGTLLDTAPDFIRILNQMRVQSGLHALPPDTIRRQVSNGARAMIQLGFGLQESDANFAATLTAFLDRYLDGLAEETQLFSGLPALLADLERQHIHWGVVTNKPSRYTDPLMLRLNLHRRCAVSICPDHVTHKKPHPEPLLLACSQLGITPQDAWYVGDHARDIEAGKRAGCTTVGVRWGYVDEAEDPADWGADYLVATPDELHKLLALPAGLTPL